MTEVENLTALRESITELDRALLQLLRRRMDLAARVGRIKAERGLPVVVRDVEDRVLTRAREHAESCGVSEEVMEAIFQAIVRGSVERQYRVGVAQRSRRGGHVLIVGGAGAMGSWLRRFFETLGHRVEIVDPASESHPGEPSGHAALGDVGDLAPFDAVFVSVPLALTPAVLEELVDRGPQALVVEIASIKSHVAPVLARARSAGVHVSALHPMFGPGKSIYEPLTFVLACQDDPETERRRLEPFLRHPYTELITMPFAHHDRLMGWLLGLAHLSGMLFGSALTRSGLTAEELRSCASTTFARQAATARSVLSEDPDLYLDIQRLNPHRNEVYGATRAALDRLVEMVESADRDRFRAELADARRALVGGP
ncbi:MAG: prephenate dehydrogenase/arogenate dehydrogenase family protein [Acidobacteriota bacterium]